ncbi:MFS transporter [Luteibacter yeojuensis]|uniref:Transporter, major facilitator family protein n=1 Tax=Luteibacter yeojuensis TaxID=345309 RepID=A0A0F3KMX1_9GAMM|nr:MFS transporter [Luteibacter yeojuensis]KJV32531.1 transporter, major facilitator family protein [Luteibacter yeojuensis]
MTKIPPQALLACLLMFCAGLADGVLVPFLPLWATGEAHVPVALVGLLFGCYAGGELLAAPFVGGIADRVGRRVVLIASSLGVGAGIAALFFVHGWLAAAGVLLVTGLFESVLHPTIMAVIADVIPQEGHRRWFSVAVVASGVGHVVGPLLGALVAMTSLKQVFLVAGAPLFVGGLVVALFLAETAHGINGEGDDDEEEEGLSALAPIFRDRRLAMLLVWVVAFEVVGNWVQAVLPIYMRDAGTLGASGVGVLFAGSAAVMAVLQLVVTRVTEQRPASSLTFVAGVATLIAFAVLSASASLPAAIIALGLVSLAHMLVGPLVPTAVSALSPPHRRASYMAASSVAVDLKDSLAPAMGTALYALSPVLPWFIGMPVVMAAALGLGRMVSGQEASRASALPQE